MGPRSFEGLMTLFEGGRTVFGVKTAIRRLMPGESTNCFPKRKNCHSSTLWELNIPETDKLFEETAICRSLELLTDKLSFLGERLPFADSAGDQELSSGRRLPFTDSIGESLVDLLGDSELFSLTKKWHLSTLLGKYQTVFQEEKRPLVNYVEESTLLGEENCSSALWGIPKCETDYLIRRELLTVALRENLD